MPSATLRPPLERLERLVAGMHERRRRATLPSVPTPTVSTRRADRAHRAPRLGTRATSRRRRCRSSPPSASASRRRWAGTSSASPTAKPPRPTMPVGLSAATTSAYSTVAILAHWIHVRSRDAARHDDPRCRGDHRDRRADRRPHRQGRPRRIRGRQGARGAHQRNTARGTLRPRLGSVAAILGNCRCARPARRSTTCSRSSTTASMTIPPTDVDRTSGDGGAGADLRRRRSRAPGSLPVPDGDGVGPAGWRARARRGAARRLAA